MAVLRCEQHKTQIDHDRQSRAAIVAAGCEIDARLISDGEHVTFEGPNTLALEYLRGVYLNSEVNPP